MTLKGGHSFVTCQAPFWGQMQSACTSVRKYVDKTRCRPGREEGKVPPLLRCGGRDAGAGGRVGPCTAQDASRMAHRSDRLPQPPSFLLPRVTTRCLLPFFSPKACMSLSAVWLQACSVSIRMIETVTWSRCSLRPPCAQLPPQ